MSQRHRDSSEHRHRLRRLKSALRADSDWSSSAMALYSRLERCEGPDWGHRYTCRSPACPACRDRYIAAQRRAALKRFAAVPAEQMAILTIILDAVPSVEQIGPTMAKARRDIRNCTNRQRDASALWAPVEVLVWLETDVIDLADYPRLGSHKQEQIGEMVQVYEGAYGPLYVPSLHGIVRLGPALDVGRVREAFQAQWPGHRRVHLDPFTVAKPVAKSVADITNYSLKHTCTTDYYDAETGEVTPREWETSWLGAYYAWMHGWSRGFQSTRIHVRPMKSKKSVGLLKQLKEIESEPMPMIHSFSVFHRDYITDAYKY